MFLSKIFSSSEINNPLLFQVSFVANQNDVRILTVGVGLQLAYPVAHVQKRQFTSQVEHQNEAHGIAKKRSGQTTEAFLAGCVPELQMYTVCATISW